MDQTNLLALVQQIQQQLSDQQNQLLAIASQQNQNQHYHLPDPPRFDGKPFTLRTWLPAIQAKLEADGLTGRQAFNYIYNRLEPPQQASVLHLQDKANPDQIFQYFQRLCYNPREKQENILRFANIRQRDDESLIAYLARFERLSHEASIGLVDQALFAITTLHRGLRRPLRETLEQVSDSLFSLSYEAYIEFLQRYDRRQPRFQTQPEPRNQPNFQKKPQNQSQNQSQNQPTSSQFINQLEPMDLSVNTTKTRPISPSNQVRIRTAQIQPYIVPERQAQERAQVRHDTRQIAI
ncbi:hypothetical protein N7495_006115 [Penicillium taxi]|uniref:uncharacterized protein n=1 Tax=Penicillium taxi TaxID=168475 RepID=UPI002545B0B1|nr:uncharacterized protein N7495_006115 [Penicillium taxi]KAJ5894424.1 hypothetical protein N7495_006115 [Penicillium taxi]